MEITGTGGVFNYKRHVAVFTFPFASHPSLLLTVINQLASTAPEVVFSFFSTAKFNRAPKKTERGCDNILFYDICDGLPEGYVFSGKFEEEIGLFLSVAEEEFKKGVVAAEKDIGMKIGCLVTDAFLWFSGDLAQELNIPWVAFWTAGASSLSAHFYTDLIRQKYAELKLKDSTGPDDEIENLIPGLSTVRLSDLPSEIIFGNLESPFATMLHKMGSSITKATAVLINSFQELDPDLTKNLSSVFNNFINIGPFNLVSKQKTPSKPDESSCISWLDTQKPGSVAYISFGTACTPSPDELVALAKALEETKTPFLWSLNKDFQKHLPLEFLEKTTINGSIGKVVNWAPQVQVLEHSAIAVFVTHCGWNSVLESIAAGVPMICRPFWGDQPINSWMVERVWRIGVRIEGGKFTKHGTCVALELFKTSSNGYKQRIEVLKELAHKSVGPYGSFIRNFKTLMDVVTGAII